MRGRGDEVMTNQSQTLVMYIKTLVAKGNKIILTSIVMSLTAYLSTPLYWAKLNRTCEERIGRNPRNAEVLRILRNMPLVSSYDDVKQALIECGVEVNWGRFVVFIRWLHRHEASYDHWKRLLEEHPALLKKAICELCVC